MQPQFEGFTKRQPWRGFQGTFKRPEDRSITYDGPKGTKLKIPGTSGEFSLTVLYDTDDAKTRYLNRGD